MIPKNGTAEERLPGKGPFKSVHERINGNHPRPSLTSGGGTELRHESYGGQEFLPHS